MEGAAKNEMDLINRYRQMSLYPEAELAVDDIINEAIVADREESPVSINLENINLSPDIKQKITENFHDDCKYLKCEQPTEEPKATENINQMVDMITDLENKA